MHGGKRPGAGRPYGSRNKATEKQKAEIDKIAASGLTPLDYMLNVMRDDQNDLATRLDAAVKAAPYVHPKLATIESKHSGLNGGGPQAVYIVSDRPMTESEWEAAYVRPG